MAFRKGAEESASASKGGNFARTQFLKLEDGESAIVRFLTDANPDENGDGGWITVDQHQMVPTKGRPADLKAESGWPERMGAVCRKDPAFKDASGNTCYICEFMKTTEKGTEKPFKKGGRSWAWACLREEVKENGKVIGIKDKTRQVVHLDADGKPGAEVTEKDIVVCNFGHKNFFGHLEGFAGHYGTALDRDYIIKRKGDGPSDTNYQIIPLDPITMDDGSVYDVRRPEILQRYGFESAQAADLALQADIASRASEEFYARFFDPRVTVPTNSSDTGAQPAPAAVPKPGHDSSPERMEALRDRVKSYAVPTAPTGPAGPTATPTAPETAPAASEPAQEAPAAPAPIPVAAGGMRAL
jgi:hypothetical protein